MLTTEQLRPILENKYNRDDWYKILRQNFNAGTLREMPVSITSIVGNEFDAKAYILGELDTSDGYKVGIYEVDTPGVKKIHRNKVGLRNLLKNVYQTDVDAALIVFTQGDKWRFSYVSEITTRNNTGERESIKTDAKRYTYLFGKDEKVKTASDRFAQVQQEDKVLGKGTTLKALQDTFSVEKMSKEFFNEYRRHYGQFLAYLTGFNEESKEVGESSPLFKTIFNADAKKGRDFVKKMLGRIVFLYFLEKKGWLGVPEEKSWGAGDPDFLHNLFKNCSEPNGFYALILEPLFYSSLNFERSDDLFDIHPEVFSKGYYNKLKIPFLNGGLFEPEAYDTSSLVFPGYLFENLFDFFDKYNFTVYEDNPEEHTIAVDPEMLGHIFENLLEDNKDKGAFYTPKEIVHYMCQESLVEYLLTKCRSSNPEESGLRDVLEAFIKYQNVGVQVKYIDTIVRALRDVKICDPAIGSGAFPMGLLQEIFRAIETCYEIDPITVLNVWDLGANWDPARVKLQIIQNSIYGVDIEAGAVDIARLRFWLSLVVDEDKPQPLPNLDYKIVVGNSLISTFEGEVIDIDWEVTAGTEATIKLQLLIQDNLKKLFAKQKLFFSYKGDKQQLQGEIRDLKIDVLISQLQLDKYKYDRSFVATGNLFEQTKKEKQKTTEIIIQLAGYDKTIRKLESLKKNSDKPLNFFDWKLNFPEVLNQVLKSNGGLDTTTGFDIVIGNPPYVEAKKLKNISPNLKKYLVYSGTSDLSSYFFEIGVTISKSTGQLCFINTNKFFNTEYGRLLRTFLLGFEIKRIVNFEQVEVFEGILVSSVIINITKNKPQHGLFFYKKFYKLKNESFVRIFNESIQHAEFYDQSKLTDCEWSFADETNLAIKSKIDSRATLLKDIQGVEIYRGITTGFNPAFIISEEEKNKLIQQNLKNKNVIKSLLQGRNIRRWYYRPSEESLLFIPWHFPLHLDETINGNSVEAENAFKNEYASLYQYLNKYKSDLSKRNVDETGIRYEWYALQRCAASYHNEFEEAEKIIWGLTADKWAFAYDSLKHYLPSNGYILTSKITSIKYLLALLNSKLLKYYFGFIGIMTAGGAYTLKHSTIQIMPIILTDEYLLFEDLVDKILALKNGNIDSDVSSFENELNRLVYNLYGLTNLEIEIIENG